MIFVVHCSFKMGHSAWNTASVSCNNETLYPETIPICFNDAFSTVRVCVCVCVYDDIERTEQNCRYYPSKWRKRKMSHVRRRPRPQEHEAYYRWFVNDAYQVLITPLPVPLCDRFPDARRQASRETWRTIDTRRVVGAELWNNTAEWFHSPLLPLKAEWAYAKLHSNSTRKRLRLAGNRANISIA